MDDSNHSEAGPSSPPRRPSESSSSLRDISLGSTSPSEEVTSPRNLVHATASAAEARAASQREENLQLGHLVEQEDKMRFYRCLDQDLLPSLSTPAQKMKAVETMSTLLLLLNNALEKGLGAQGDAKYLQIKLSNPAIRKKLDLDSQMNLQGKGAPALDWLHLCGWRHTVQNFQEYCSFPAQPSPRKLAELRTGTDILKVRLQREKETLARSEERQIAARQEEGGRKKLAMLQYKEDRLSKQEKDERERLARKSRTEAKLAQTSDAFGSPTIGDNENERLKED